MRYECSPSPQRRDVCILSHDGEPWKEVHTSIFGKSPRIDAASEEDFELLEYRLAKNYVLRCLARKNYSSYELKKNLFERLISDENANRIIDEMAALGYINDNDWTCSFIRGQMAKKQGSKMIALKLKAKGVPEEEIEKHLVSAEEEHPPEERIRFLLTTKYRNRDLNDYKEKQKVIGSLLRKGFDYETVLGTMNSVL